jgi:hypothetical protein
MNIGKKYREIINKLFPTLVKKKINELSLLLLSNHENNLDEYESNISTKFIIDNINVINIDDLLNCNIDELLNNKNYYNLKKCILYYMITDVLQKKIYIAYSMNINYSNHVLESLIKLWHNYLSKLNCINFIDKDRLYDIYKANYRDILINIICKKKIIFVSI